MEIYDISVGIDENLPIWPGDPRPSITWLGKLSAGDVANISALDLGAHTGTHIDAPLHFLADGMGLDGFPLSTLIGDVQVLELPEEVHLITKDVIESQLDLISDKLLFKTRNSRFWSEYRGKFQEDFTALDSTAAELLVRLGVKLVGIDYLSIAPFNNPTPTHEILLRGNVVILESIDLSEVSAGSYELVCLPIKLTGREAAPARAVLIRR